jgi:hypothetical protein
VYYGYGPLPEISSYDIAILEPAGWRREDVQALRGQGVRCIAYLSAMEATRATLNRVGVAERQLLRLGEGPWRREQFDTYVVDPRARTWREYVLREASRLVAEGWDGVFLDNLGDVEDQLVQDRSGWLLPAAADLVRGVRQAVGDRLLLQNNGIFLLLPLVAQLIDGVCWEGSFDPNETTGPWLRMVLEQIATVVRQEGITPMLLGEIGEDSQAAERLEFLRGMATRYGFLAYAAPMDYAKGIRTLDGTPVAGRTAPAGRP